MSTPTPVRVSTGAARRFLIEALGLTGDGAYAPTPRASANRVLNTIRRMEAVQLDPVAAVERNQHLVLAARLTGYSPKTMAQLLAARRVFEYWANAACVIPIEDYWMFGGVRERMRRADRRERAVLRGPALVVLRELERNGPLPSRAFVAGRRIAGYWDNTGPKTKATSHALNVLWYRGEVMVVRREGVERYFDLPHRVVPADVLRHAERVSMADADAALFDKYLRAYRIFDLGDFRFGWRRIPAPERRQIVERYIDEGTIVPLELPGVKRRYFALAEDVERIRRHERDAGAFSADHVRFLAPLDNLLWRRERLADLFDFTYTWEIYTPAHKRRFGYYTMPILAGDRLIGRMDPRLDRARGRLVVQALHLEPGVKATPALRRALRGTLDAFATFHGAGDVTVERTSPRLTL
ncbi:MAG: hypothetical protein A2V59_02885 [Armatimonadetes bacterium RBG_19FT_COMBO_69_19]|nr:MAG: hypothetical protein A2V59_02885 [Armatimonadetes bacterium RBG_19FT_COMBO_69_19]